MRHFKAILWAACILFAPEAAFAQGKTTSAAQDAACVDGTHTPCLRAPVLAAPGTRTAGTVDWIYQLLYGALPVGTPPLTYTGNASATVGTSSGPLFTAGTYTRVVLICTLPGSTANVWLRLDGSAAAPSTGVVVNSGGGCTPIGPVLPMPTATVTAITDGVTAQTVTLAGG